MLPSSVKLFYKLSIDPIIPCYEPDIFGTKYFDIVIVYKLIISVWFSFTLIPFYAYKLDEVGTL